MKPTSGTYVWMAGFALCLSQVRALAGDVVTPTPATSASLSAPASTNAVQMDEDATSRPGGRVIWGLRWDNGLQYEFGGSGRVARLKTRHPDLDVQPWRGKIGAKLHLDAAAYHADSELGAVPDDSGVRRARLFTSGGFSPGVPVSYKAEAEVADQDFYIREAYLWFWNVPVVRTVKVGHFKAPMTMEGYTGSGDTLFLERASPVEAFGPGIIYGIQAGARNAKGDMTWALGWFADGGKNDISESSRSFTRAIGRVTWLPWYEEVEGSPQWLHVGASGQYLYSSEKSVRYRSRPESYFAPRLVDTGDMDAQDATSAGLECAWVDGPWCLQAELLDTIVNQEDNTLDFWGGYVAGSWMMTGESHPYNRTLGCLTRPTPRNPFSFRQRRFGAWEAAARFSHLDLTDAEVRGGVMHIATIGLNGYLTPRLKVMFDYALGRMTDAAKDGDLRMAEGRVQYEF